VKLKFLVALLLLLSLPALAEIVTVPFGSGAGSDVSSFSGDDALLCNSLSTGAVTAVLCNAVAYSVWGNPTGSSATPEYTTSPVVSGTSTANNFVATGTSADTIPVGSTAQRPASPATGNLRFNSTTQEIEAYYNALWIVIQPYVGGGLSTTASGATNSAALQAQINAWETYGVSTILTDWGIPGIQIPAGTYAMSAGITMAPWIKIITAGTVEFNFSGASPTTQATNNTTAIGNATLHFSATPSTCVPGAYLIDTTSGHTSYIPTGTMISSTTSSTIVMTSNAVGLIGSGDVISCAFIAFNVNNDTVPTGSFTNYENAANLSPFLNAQNGSLIINGPGNTTNSSGLLLGSASNSPATDANVRELKITGVAIQNFDTCLELRAYALYMLRFTDGGKLTSCTNGVATSQGSSNVNSGELMVWDGWTIAGMTNAFYFDTPNIDTTVMNSSIDYNTYVAVSTTNDTYAKHEFSNDHLEYLTSLVNGPSTSYYLQYVFHDNKFVSDSGSGSATPAPLFTGQIYLDLDSMYVGGYSSSTNSPSNLFMASSAVIPIRMNKIMYTDFSQLTSPSALQNDDPCFSKGVNGANLSSAPPVTYATNIGTGITATVSNSTVWTTGYCSTSLSFKFVYVSGTNNYAQFVTDRIPVQPGDVLVADEIFQTNEASSTGTIYQQFIYSSCNGAIATTTDGAAYGDTIGADVGANAWSKMANTRYAIVPSSVCYAQLATDISVGSGETVYVGFNGVTKE